MTTSIINNKKRYSVIIFLLLQSIFLENTCNGQFHWAKNYRLEAEKLRELLQRITQDGQGSQLQTSSKVRKSKFSSFPSYGIQTQIYAVENS